MSAKQFCTITKDQIKNNNLNCLCFKCNAANPTWTSKPPQNVIAMEEGSAKFECLVDGNPKPVIQWSLDGKPIQGEHVKFHFTFYLNITRASNILCTILFITK